MEKNSPLQTICYIALIATGFSGISNNYSNTGHSFDTDNALNYQSYHPIVEVQYPDTPHFLKDSMQIHNYQNLVSFAEGFLSKLETIPEKFDYLFKENMLSILA